MKKEKSIIIIAVALIITVIMLISNLINRPPVYDTEKTVKYTVSFPKAQKEGGIYDSSLSAEQLVGTSGNLELYYSSEKAAVRLLNKKSGYSWSSIPENASRGENALGQLCSVVYINTESDNTGTLNNLNDNCILSAEGIKNGVEISFNFQKEELEFSLEIWLEDGRMWAKIPLEDISEKSTYRLLSVDLLPFFGAFTADNEGYIFFPDAAGAIYPLNSSPSNIPITLDVYSDRIVDVTKIKEDFKKGICGAMLPVYGVKQGDNAFVAYIADGAESSAVTLGPNGYILNMSRVYSSSVYRKVTEIVSDSGISTYKADSGISTGDFSVCYQLLENENADYSGMARAVRGLMDEFSLLPESDMKKSSLKLDVMMGAREKTMLGEKHQTVTDLDALSNILKELSDNSNGTTAVLIGWQKQGYGIYPDNAVASSSIGELSSFTEPENTEIYLDYNTILADVGEKGAASRRDAIRNSEKITILSEDKKSFIMNANSCLELFEKIEKKLFDNKLSGVSLAYGGSILYDDYNKRAAMTRLQTKNTFAYIMDKTSEQGGLIVSRANSYALKYADWLSDLPESGSGYPMLEEVPFYYLLVSGKAPYSTDVAGNLSADFRKTKLKWIEYGAVPYFMVSDKGGKQLSNTPAQIFFSVKYSDEKERIEKTVEEFDELKSKLGDSIVSHERISEGVYRTDYQKGGYTIVNYNETEYDLNGVKIPPIDYIVKAGEGE